MSQLIFIVVTGLVMWNSIIAGWAVYFVPLVLLWLWIAAIKRERYEEVPGLSERANAMIQKFGHYYRWPVASRIFSAFTSGLTLAAIVLAIINLFQEFWWGIGLGIIGYVLSSRVAWMFNPTQFISNAARKGIMDAQLDLAAHEEVIKRFYKV